MSLNIETFTNPDRAGGWRPGNNFGGRTLFKALGHPKTAAAARAIVAKLEKAGRVAIYDPGPEPAIEHFDAFFSLAGCTIAGLFVQRVEDIGRERLGQIARPVTELGDSHPDLLFVAAFDAQGFVQQIAPRLPQGCAVVTLDDMRLPVEWLSNPRQYLDPLNFATNFGFLRDGDGQHSRIVSANYWSGYGASEPALWLSLFGAQGETLAEWTEKLPGAFGSFAIDSREVRRRHGLGAFAGSLFMHALRVKGHDVVKYALDVFSGDGTQLSCTHDANAWPADLYAGVPAPEDGERIILWLQNSHPVAIPPRAVGVNLIGSQDIAYVEDAVPPFGTRAVDLGRLLPAARWPAQIEIQAGRYFVRPRYETIRANGRSRIAHANVERTDLKPNPDLPGLGKHMGKGYVMPLPVLPLAEFRTTTLPTPMAVDQRELPLKVLLYDASGEMVAEEYLGRIARRESAALDVDAWLAKTHAALKSGHGHVEYLYDFRNGGEADGWLHALARYEQRASGHAAETIFGAHIYNTPIVYRDEPQSYTHRPPGLTTRLFLRLADDGWDTICHLIYPASLPWRAQSSTSLTLFTREAREVASRSIEIPCGGSRFWRVSETFTDAERHTAGAGAWVQVRDATCRLFGYHGLINGHISFSLDHMFGF